MEPGEQHSFICGRLAAGADDGAIDLLASQWLEPGVAVASQAPAWRHRAWVYGERLADCAAKTQDSQLRARVGRLVLGVLQETLAAPDRNLRFNKESPHATGEGWLDAKPLCRALALTRPSGVVGLLAAIMADTSLPIRVRSHALLAYGELGGKRPASADAIVAELLASDPDPGFSDDGRMPAWSVAGSWRRRASPPHGRAPRPKRGPKRSTTRCAGPARLRRSLRTKPLLTAASSSRSRPLRPTLTIRRPTSTWSPGSARARWCARPRAP